MRVALSQGNKITLDLDVDYSGAVKQRTIRQASTQKPPSSSDDDSDEEIEDNDEDDDGANNKVKGEEDDEVIICWTVNMPTLTHDEGS